MCLLNKINERYGLTLFSSWKGNVLTLQNLCEKWSNTVENKESENFI